MKAMNIWDLDRYQKDPNALWFHMSLYFNLVNFGTTS